MLEVSVLAGQVCDVSADAGCTLSAPTSAPLGDAGADRAEDLGTAEAIMARSITAMTIQTTTGDEVSRVMSSGSTGAASIQS